jgi:predicted transcriptional regulator
LESIKIQLIRKGIIQKECADEFGITQTAVSLVLKGKSTSARVKKWFTDRGIQFE